MYGETKLHRRMFGQGTAPRVYIYKDAEIRQKLSSQKIKK